MCMTLRGVQKPGATTYTAFFTGAYEKDAAMRTEIYSILASSGMTASMREAAAAPALSDPSAGHGAHGLGSPRFARSGPAVVAGSGLPVGCLDHVGAPSDAFAVSQLPRE